MREIKFRGKSLKTKKWVYGDLMRNICGTRIVRYKETDNGSYKRADWEYIDVDPATLGQFTGLTDCNGKEIYEGDLIKDSEFTNEVYFLEDIGAFMVEEYKSECDAPKIFLCSDVAKESEVVGNIHDNQPNEV